MNGSGFGAPPYRHQRYGPIVQASIEELRMRLGGTSGEHERLGLILEIAKKGDFSCTNALRRLFQSNSGHARMYAAELYADICSHSEVEFLREVVDQPSIDSWDIEFALLLLGRTLSLRAVPLILQMRERFSGTVEGEVDQYASDALQTLLSIEGLNADNVSEPWVERACSAALVQLDPNAYYFEGKPVFAGDLTKQVITHAAIARKEETPFALWYEPEILSVFSGIGCPVAAAAHITNGVFREVLDYTKVLARMQWSVGTKYFYGHPIPTDADADAAARNAGLQCIEDRVVSLCEQGDGLRSAGDYGGAFRCYLRAWEILPEPKEQCRPSSWILAAIGDTHFSLGQFAESIRVLKQALNCVDSSENPYLHLRIGESLFELGDMEAAAGELRQAYRSAGRELFEGEDPKYLSFLMTVP